MWNKILTHIDDIFFVKHISHQNVSRQNSCKYSFFTIMDMCIRCIKMIVSYKKFICFFEIFFFKLFMEKSIIIFSCHRVGRFECIIDFTQMTIQHKKYLHMFEHDLFKCIKFFFFDSFFSF